VLILKAGDYIFFVFMKIAKEQYIEDIRLTEGTRKRADQNIEGKYVG